MGTASASNAFLCHVSRMGFISRHAPGPMQLREAARKPGFIWSSKHVLTLLDSVSRPIVGGSEKPLASAMFACPEPT